MSWNVEFTDEFGTQYGTLTQRVQDDFDRVVGLLEAKGAQLPHPSYSSGIAGSRHAHMRELRIETRRRALPGLLCLRPAPHRDPAHRRQQGRRHRFYDIMIPVADDLYDAHLAEIREEGLI